MGIVSRRSFKRLKSCPPFFCLHPLPSPMRRTEEAAVTPKMVKEKQRRRRRVEAAVLSCSSSSSFPLSAFTLLHFLPLLLPSSPSTLIGGRRTPRFDGCGRLLILRGER